MLEKLFILREELLLEATDLSSSETIIRSIERGQVPGVGKTLLDFRDKRTMEMTFENLIAQMKKLTTDDEYNRFMVFILSRAKSMENLFWANNYLDGIVEVVRTYFNNINKKEAKEDPKIKNKFEEFSKLDLEALMDSKVREDFEDFIDVAFAHKAKMTDKDIEVIYRKDGWEVVHVKTFSANKKFACMNGRKSRWCTSARLSQWNIYAEGGRKIYVIRSQKENKMYQMDFGTDEEGLLGTSFNDENNDSIKTFTVLKEIPRHVLEAIKDKNGRSVYALLAGDKDRDEFLTQDERIKEIKGHLPYKSFNELSKELKKYGKELYSYKQNPSSQESAGIALSKTNRGITSEINMAGKYTDEKNSFIYIIPKQQYAIYQTFALKDIKTGRDTQYKGATIFKIQENRLVPFSLRSFLEYKLPKELDELLNDTVAKKGSEFNKGEELKLKGESEGGSLPLVYSKDNFYLYKISDNLKDYLKTPGITNENLLNIKKYIIGSKESENQLLGVYKSDLFYADFSKREFALKIKTLRVSRGSMVYSGYMYFLDLLPIAIRKDFYNFIVKNNYFKINSTIGSLKKDDEEIITRAIPWALNGKTEEPFILKDFKNGVKIIIDRPINSVTGKRRNVGKRLMIQVGEDVITSGAQLPYKLDEKLEPNTERIYRSLSREDINEINDKFITARDSVELLGL